MLGDMLRKEYIAIWGVVIRPSDIDISSRRFRDQMDIGHKVVLVADECVWAIGEITGSFKKKITKG